jgi:phospholipid/cholesterol/gamma-HCH transport system permease protein
LTIFVVGRTLVLMEATTATRAAERSGADGPSGYVWRESWWWSVIDQMAGMVSLVWHCGRVLFSRPLSWKRELFDECARIIRRVTIPLALADAFFIFGAGTILSLLVLKKIGADDRYGFAIAAGGPREFEGWITAMCVAGIAGTAVCSDLGARKVREELDAMLSLGLDPYRLLVLPRLLALTIMSPLLFLWSAMCGLIVAGVTGTLVAGYPIATFIHAASTYSLIDLFAALIKVTLIGFIIGVASCFKGMNAKGGPAGVGRAVNQAVVISFAATWILNFLFNSLYLAAFPAAQYVR